MTIDKIFRPTVISKMGLSSKTKLEIIHASHRYGGRGIPTSWEIQGALQVHMLVSHIQLRNSFSKQILLNMSYLYLHIGHKKEYVHTVTPSSREI